MRNYRLQKNGWWVDKSFHTFPISSYVQNGINEVRIDFVIQRPKNVEEQGDFEGYRNRFSYKIEPENIYVKGNFNVKALGEITEAIEDIRVRGNFVITDASEKQDGELTGQGLWFYRGNVSYKAFFDKIGERQALSLKEFRGTAAAVYVNGNYAGIIYRSPYSLSISDYVKDGTNELEIILYGTNCNLLGPHHHVMGNPHFVGVPTFTGQKGFTDFIYPQIVDENTYTEQYSFVKLCCGKILLEEV